MCYIMYVFYCMCVCSDICLCVRVCYVCMLCVYVMYVSISVRCATLRMSVMLSMYELYIC